MADQYIDLVDKRVLVTGGTRGIGAAIAEKFASAGAKVAVTGRTIRNLPSSVAMGIEADMVSASGVAEVAAKIEDQWGGVDVLINNLGASNVNAQVFSDLDDGTWHAELEVNLMAPVRIDRFLVPGMVSRGRGAVIHIGSIAHIMPQTGPGIAYSAAKAALRAYSKALSKEVVPKGVRVNMISPGYIETSGTARAIANVQSQLGCSQEEARREVLKLVGDIPLGRTGYPEDIAELAVFMASDRASFIVGVDYLIDGGSVPTV